ncbi:hypothetical protein BV22DRAFT_1088685 [Leucogyrophana mollusca]|uniref:Uncharacterized protein n=1 Tax=Leucogyrophana mollusca TaxID=85980 RepID=A0ACB8BJV5_9AGAM|nr:hypothetical protein BV22DRAFT_1088685 [Leucogyrophana mollusca]
MPATAPRPPANLKGRSSSSKAPQARRSPLVDTNIHSYDRTDPFFAINVLRKLLGSLPSRIGGCQYKLSPEEHKLSLHLLTIVEPFVGLAQSRRTLTRQPTEILDAISFHIDSKRDLLSLALSCQRLYGVIFPRHYEYRVIRAKVSSISVWNHLIVNRSLAQNVRRLEVVDERSTDLVSVPSGILMTETDLESSEDELGMHTKQERFLASALTKMVALRSFFWSCNHSPISIDNIWPTLLKCQSINEVVINDNLVFSPYTLNSDNAPKNTRRSPALLELKAVAMQSTRHVYGSTKTPQLTRISGMLTKCPNLESLNIGYEHRRGQGYQHPPADDFFLCSRWPGLRSLSLTNIRCSSAHGLDAAATFFGAHTNLEVLHLDFSGDGASSGSGPLLSLPPNSLPRLRELYSSKDIATAILASSCDAPRPLELIKGVRLSGPTWDQPFFTALKSYGSTVKRFELAGWNDIDDVGRLVGCLPRLTWLDVGKKDSESLQQPRRSESQAKASPVTVVNTNVAEWATILAPLTELTAFLGLKFFYEVSSLTLANLSSSSPSSLSASELSRVRKNEKVANVFANKCSKLRRLEHWEDGKIIVLLREGSEVKWDVRRVKA